MRWRWGLLGLLKICRSRTRSGSTPRRSFVAYPLDRGLTRHTRGADWTGSRRLRTRTRTRDAATVWSRNGTPLCPQPLHIAFALTEVGYAHRRDSIQVQEDGVEPGRQGLQGDCASRPGRAPGQPRWNAAGRSRNRRLDFDRNLRRRDLGQVVRASGREAAGVVQEVPQRDRPAEARALRDRGLDAARDQGSG